MKKKRSASSYLLIILSIIAVILILLIVYFTIRQKELSTSTEQTKIQTARSQEEDGFISGDTETNDGFTSGNVADNSDSPEDSSEQENAGPMPVTRAPEKEENTQNQEIDQPEPAPNDTSRQSESSSAASSSDTPEANAKNGSISPSQGNSVFDNKADQTMEELLAQLRTLLPSANGSWSVYICDLSGGSEGTINDFSMQAASLIKLYIMGAVYENYDNLTQQYGTQTIDGYLLPMITVSDNDAANSLVSCLGGGDSSAGMEKVNSFCKEHGYNSTSMGRLLLASNEFGDNYTSAYDCGKFLKEIYQSCTDTSASPILAHAEDMYSLLKQQQRSNKIPAALPEGVKTANKTGELSNVENDAGILYDTSSGNDLVICFLSENLTDTSAAQNTIAQLSRTIYLTYNS